MDKATENQITETKVASRSLSPLSIVNLIGAALMLIGFLFLPWVLWSTNAEPGIAGITGLQILGNADWSSTFLYVPILSGAAVLLALWTIIDARAKRIANLTVFIIGVVIVLGLLSSAVFFNQVRPADAPEGFPTEFGFWLTAIGAVILIVQFFIPRPASSVKGYGEVAMEDFAARMGVIGELMGFLWKRKLYWLIPMMVTLIVFAAFIILGSNPVTQPFIYTLF